MSARPVPLVATLVVVSAVGIMIALGLWQLDRKQEKEAQLAQLSANLALPAIAYPMLGPVEPKLLFRRSSVTCLSVAGYSVKAGGDADGTTGFRYIAQCATGAEGPGARVVLGVGGKPDLELDWNGGTVSGWIVPEREESGLIATLSGHDAPTSIMLVADQGQAGLKTPAVPSVDSVPNNHFAYAIQWFLFAGIAAIIYLILLRRRWTAQQSV